MLVVYCVHTQFTQAGTPSCALQPPLDHSQPSVDLPCMCETKHVIKLCHLESPPLSPPPSPPPPLTHTLSAYSADDTQAQLPSLSLYLILYLYHLYTCCRKYTWLCINSVSTICTINPVRVETYINMCIIIRRTFACKVLVGLMV